MILHNRTNRIPASRVALIRAGHRSGGPVRTGSSRIRPWYRAIPLHSTRASTRAFGYDAAPASACGRELGFDVPRQMTVSTRPTNHSNIRFHVLPAFASRQDDNGISLTPGTSSPCTGDMDASGSHPHPPREIQRRIQDVSGDITGARPGFIRCSGFAKERSCGPSFSTRRRRRRVDMGPA